MNYQGNLLSFGELTDIHYVYCLCDGNTSAAIRMYSEKYPGRVLPGRRLFETLHRNLRETGSFISKKEGSGRKVS
jgi:hypothetical protein